MDNCAWYRLVTQNYKKGLYIVFYSAVQRYFLTRKVYSISLYFSYISAFFTFVLKAQN